MKNLSMTDVMGLVGLGLLTTALYMALGTPAAMGFVGAALLIAALFVAAQDSKNNDDPS